MYRTIKSIVLPLVIAIAIGFAIIVLNQTLQLVDLADRIHPVAGTAVLVLVLAVFAVGIGYPLYAYLRLPKPLVPPSEPFGPAFDRYRGQLADRLSDNHHLGNLQIKDSDLDEALRKLDKVAEETTKDFAKKVFLGTAISQNGSIDSLIVLAAQGRLVYEIACIYNQRPAARELAYLYTNVAATAFVAGELEDIDIAEHIQPVLTAIAGSSIAAIPGMSAAAGLFINSVVTGAGNAYLTLRVGLLTRRYCGLSTERDRRTIRSNAATEALPLLGSIVAEGAASVASSIWARPKKFFQDLFNKIKWPWGTSNAAAN
jgi:hypothetical protein